MSGSSWPIARAGCLASAPDQVREALYAALGIHCVYRPGKKQVTIRATLTNSTPGIVAALLADPRTGTDIPTNQLVRLTNRTLLL